MGASMTGVKAKTVLPINTINIGNLVAFSTNTAAAHFYQSPCRSWAGRCIRFMSMTPGPSLRATSGRFVLYWQKV